MSVQKFDLTYSRLKIWNKDLFIFVNHKVATLCWAILREKNELCDVITFDSHRDYRDGIILQRKVTQEFFTLPIEKRGLSSKYNRVFPHFTTSKEFMDWNLLDQKQNYEIVKEQKYFSPLNDNFIDIAFMKNIVKNVYCYYLKTRNQICPGKCDDIIDGDHIFEMINIKDRRPNPEGKYILDIDLDFFVKCNYESDDPSPAIISEPNLKRNLNIIKSLAIQKNCIAITIALEPGCCGSAENCLKICEYVSEAFGKDIVHISRHRIREAMLPKKMTCIAL